MRSLALAPLAAVSVAAITLASGAASAADLRGMSMGGPVPFLRTAPVFTWTGFYAGLQGGYAFGEAETDLFANTTVIPPTSFGRAIDPEMDGFVGGVHAGFNVQFGQVVAGVEGDLELSGAEGDVVAALGAYAARFRSEVDWQGSARARLGFAADRALIYVTGGLAFAHFVNDFTVTVPAIGGVGAGTYALTGDADTEWGWTLGGGVEYAFQNNLTARVEYRYTVFDAFDAGLHPSGLRIVQEPEFHTVRVGVSYKY